MSKEIAEEYASSLSDLTVNSKPLINMLTILAEENIEHAGTIVETVEKHLEKVNPDIKLPVLYLVDSIIKNVGGAYTTKFSQSIVNMFTRTFKQVDEKVRSQMFKLRETWHDVFPATKLYQLDVKVNLIDPAWPIQAQPQQSNIHPLATTSVAPPAVEDEKMRSLVAKKEHELLMLQQKKIQMELEQTRRQLELAEKQAKKMPVVAGLSAPAGRPPSPAATEAPPVSVKSRLGPPVPKPSSGGRIAPVSAALISARRDPRLARLPAGLAPPAQNIAPNVFDIKPLDRVTKRKNVITIDVRPDDIPVPRRDPRFEKRLDDKTRREKIRRDDRRKEEDKKREAYSPRKNDADKKDKVIEAEKKMLDNYMEKLNLPDPKRINKLPPIPKKNRDENKDKEPVIAVKRKKELVRIEKKKKRDNSMSSKDSSSSSPEKKVKNKDIKRKPKQKEEVEIEGEKNAETEVVSFKELKNYNKDRYRRNREKSESPEKVVEENSRKEDPIPESESSNVADALEMKDVDLRVLPSIGAEAAQIVKKRPSTEALENKSKKTKVDKFDILFGNEDVDLRQLPQVEEVCPPPPAISDTKTEVSKPEPIEEDPSDEKEREDTAPSPLGSPKKDWHEVKEKEDVKKTPSKLDLVRAKLAEATKGKDRLGRPLLFSKSPSVERERRRTISTEDVDLRAENGEEFDAADHKKTISIIMSQAKEQFSDGQLDRNQYNTLMFQVLQLNEKLKLKEAKQRESLEISKRKLKAHLNEENHKTSPKSPSENRFGDIDERLPVFDADLKHDSDMRLAMPMDNIDGLRQGMLPRPPIPPSNMFMGPYQPVWRGPRPRMEEFGPRNHRQRGPMPTFFRGNIRPNFNARMPNLPPHLPVPKMGMCQGESPLKPYSWTEMPPPLGSPGYIIPPTDVRILEYIDQDPMKSTQIDGVPREIRFYGDTAVIMLDWDDPREIKFLPGSRRVTFDNKDSIVLNFDEGYKQVEIDDQTFDIKFGSPTRELYINGRWHECLFGGAPVGVIIDGKPRLIHLEGPLPQVDIGKSKRIDLVAGKVNLIIDATQMMPVYLDAKVQKFHINDHLFTIRFADALTTVLINEVPFKVEFGGIPKPIFIGNERHFVKFSGLPRYVKPGYIEIANMEGRTIPMMMKPLTTDNGLSSMEVDQEDDAKPFKSPSPDRENQDLDILASVMPSTIAPASGSEYNLAEPMFAKPEKIPGLDTSIQETPAPTNLSILGNINVSDLFAKLVETGIVQVAPEPKKEEKEKEKEIEKPKKEDVSIIHRVDLLRPETMRGKQPGVVSLLYGGMQCSGCGCRFPPEQTVRYSQHLDWHFRQNRRDRDSARRPHARHWHYDLSDWLQYEELDDLEEREKSWFEKESQESVLAAEAAPAQSVRAGAPRAHACSLCGDRFQQFYNEDHEEWHLRNAVTHDGLNYHPLCYEDFKASQTKKEEAVDESLLGMTSIDKVEEEEAIEIAEDDLGDNSDNESVVEVVEQEKIESLEIDEEEEGDEDDVVLKAEPVEQVVVDDEVDTDDETADTRAQRDKLAAIDFANVRVKQEPVDPDDEPIITAEEAAIKAAPDTTHTTVLSSIDGNVQFDAAPTAAPSAFGGIRINISKTIPSFLNNNQEERADDVSVDDEPLPPGEEPEVEYKLKPSLEGVVFSRQPPVKRGKDLSALCSIM